MRAIALALLLAAPLRAQTAPPVTAPAAPPAFPPNAEADRYAPLDPVPGCGERALPAASAPRLPDAAFAAMRAYHDSQKGLGLLVMVDGKVERELYAPGMGAATRTATASMHKSVLALLTGIAIQRRLMPGEDQPLSAFLPVAGDKGAVPLRAFLTMSSGMRNYRFAEPESRRIALGPGISDVALAAPMEKPFDSEFKYNNANSQILGEALSAAVAKRGMTYAQALSTMLWCPLGNAPATLWVEAPGKPRFYAGLNANLRDWARIGEMIRQQGKVGRRQVVPAAWLAKMTAPSKASANYGYQMWRGSPYVAVRRYSPESPTTVAQSAPYRADDVLYFDGFGGQRVYIVPSAKLVIARTGETSMSWDDAVLVNLALDGLKR